MIEEQYELNLYGDDLVDVNISNMFDIKFLNMQKKLDEIHESMGKVRRKLFAEMGEVKRICLELKYENENLQSKLREVTNEKMEWVYSKGDRLFDVKERKEACG